MQYHVTWWVLSSSYDFDIVGKWLHFDSNCSSCWKWFHNNGKLSIIVREISKIMTVIDS